MKIKLLAIAGLAFALCLGFTQPMEAGFNLGGIRVTLPGGGGGNSSGGTIAAPKVDSTLDTEPKKIQVTLNSPLGFDEHSKYMIRGKVVFANTGRSVPEYTVIYLVPKDAVFENNILESGYYGKGYTNTEGYFELRAKPGDYAIFINQKNAVAFAPATAQIGGPIATYALKSAGGQVRYRK